jgi:alpha-glucosidase
MRFLGGRAGEYVAIARRRGDDWYAGVITDWTAREIDVPLGFLGKGDYVADIYADAADAGANPKRAVIGQKRVNAAGTLGLSLAQGGGAAIRFHPVN